MTITLTSAQEELVRRKIDSGQFASPDDVVNEALLLFDAQYHEDPLLPDELRKAILHAEEQFECGEYTTYNADTLKGLFDQIGVEGRKRFAERQQNAVS